MQGLAKQSDLVMQLPSKFQPNDFCAFEVQGMKIGAQVTKVSFTNSKVLYDLEIATGPGQVTRIHSVDSVFVTDLGTPPSFSV